jgi:hypothetical protein
MIEEDVMMSGPSAQPRILFVTPEVAFMPEGTGNSFFQHRLIYHKSFGNGTLPNRFCRKNTTTSMKHPTDTQAEEMKR